MPYLALRFDLAGADADAWSDALLAAGALSVDLADPHAGGAREAPVYAEPGAEAASWPLTRLTALFPADANAAGALASAAAALGAPRPLFEIHSVADDDWVRRTQAQFAPIRIAERLWIVPSWCAPVDPNAINVTLDPGLAFGTGAHPTTRLCLQWLARELRPGATVLDYGCGSGVLAITAAKLGAARVVGVDVDPQALGASAANAAANGVVAEFVGADVLAARGGETFDVVVANILANPLRMLAPVLAARVREFGRVVLSGILATQSDDVAAAYARWFIMIDREESDDGWVALAGTRRETTTA
jgi:ribosomal protein L11 methyltransferase